MSDDIIHITDDEAAREFLQRNDLLRTLEQECAFTHGVTACCKLDHVTHWILAVRYDGHTNPADNGYIVFGWPKARFPKSVIDDQLRELNISAPSWRREYRKDDPSGLQ